MLIFIISDRCQSNLNRQWDREREKIIFILGYGGFEGRDGAVEMKTCFSSVFYARHIRLTLIQSAPVQFVSIFKLFTQLEDWNQNALMILSLYWYMYICRLFVCACMCVCVRVCSCICVSKKHGWWIKRQIPFDELSWGHRQKNQHPKPKVVLREMTKTVWLICFVVVIWC